MEKAQKKTKNKPNEYTTLLLHLMDGSQLPESERQRVRQVYDLVMSLGFDEAKITIDGNEYCAAEYALTMYSLASIEFAPKFVPQMNVDERLGSLMIITMLVAMAESMQSSWSYGAELLYHRAAKGIPVPREEVLAFMAQEGTFSSCKEKTQRLNGNWMAVAVYCAKQYALYHELPKVASAVFADAPENEQPARFSPDETKGMTQREQVEYLMRTYAPACLGEDEVTKHQIEYFLSFLAESDFYDAPASTKYHASHPQGLVWHELNVTEGLIELLQPKTAKQIGQCVLAGIGHDLCKVSFYSSYLKNEKVYNPNGSQHDAMGNFDWQSKVCYFANPVFPLGHGGKSLHILASYFGPKLPIQVAAAIDAHMMDNPQIGRQVAQYPLGLWLAIADVVATCIDEAEPIL